MSERNRQMSTNAVDPATPARAKWWTSPVSRCEHLPAEEAGRVVDEAESASSVASPGTEV